MLKIPQYEGEEFVSMRKATLNEEGKLKGMGKIIPDTSNDTIYSFHVSSNTIYLYTVVNEDGVKDISVYAIDEEGDAEQITRTDARKRLQAIEDATKKATAKWESAIDDKLTKESEVIASSSTASMKPRAGKRTSQQVLERQVGIAKNRVDKLIQENKELKEEGVQLRRELGKLETRITHVIDTLSEQERQRDNNMQLMTESLAEVTKLLRETNDLTKRNEAKVRKQLTTE